MDQETRESIRSDDNLSQVDCFIVENSTHPVNGVILDTVAVTNSVEPMSVSRENGHFRLEKDGVGSNRAVVELQDAVLNHQTCNSRAVDENSSNSAIDEDLFEFEIVRISEQNAGFTEESGSLGLTTDEMGSGAPVVKAPDSCNRQGVGERVGQTDLGATESFTNAANVIALETVITINSGQTSDSRGQNRDLEAGSNELGSTKAVVENVPEKVFKREKESCVIDMNSSGGNGDGKESKENPEGERVCRICHLGPEQLLETKATTASSTSLNLIQLGCGCKDELGVAHIDCAETWFKLKGNRLCEICGQSARNITGVGDYRFMEEWNEHRFIGSSSSSERGGCWGGQPFCNFLMACLVIAFVLPWFFRVNMF